jgi:hypothetical protein
MTAFCHLRTAEQIVTPVAAPEFPLARRPKPAPQGTQLAENNPH